MKAITHNATIIIGIPRFWNNQQNYNTLPENIHLSDGWKPITYPTVVENQRLGDIYERENDFTYQVIDFTPEEIRQNILNQAESQRQERISNMTVAIQESQIMEPFQSITDEVELLENQDIFPMWSVGKSVLVNEKYQWLEGLELKLYRVLQSHTTQADWEPYLVPSLFVKVLLPGAALIWESGISVTVGQEYEYQQNTYIVVQSHTTETGWEPPNAPSLWTPKPQ